MLTIYSNEVDIELSEQNSDNRTDYKFNDDYIDDDDEDNNECLYSSVNETTATSKKSNTLIVNSKSYSYYDRKNLSSPSSTESKIKFHETDHFDPNEFRNLYKDIDYMGDKVDSDGSTKTDIVSQYAFEQAFKLNQLRREIVCNSKSDSKSGRAYNNKSCSKSSNLLTNSKRFECLPSTKKYLSSQTVGKSHKSNYKLSATKEITDMDSVTLLIRVPRSKLINHIKNKSIAESWKTISAKTSSCESLSSNADNDSDTIQENSKSSERERVKKKADYISESNITSLIDKSNEISPNLKESMKKSNKKLQTLQQNITSSSNRSDKITQTTKTSHDGVLSSNSNHKNYFLCNICHKIVPATLSPVCLKLSCSAIKKCKHIFHSELDMIMHLPVKHTNEFASYHICSKCNRMYHPSNIVTIKGCYTCLDCVATLVQLTIDD